MTQPVKIGLVGLGGISRAHLVGYERCASRARITAVCDQDATVAERVAQRLGARAFTNLDALLEQADVDAVDLTLPHDVHFSAAVAALASGRHVLVEKPLAMTSDECRTIIDLAGSRGLTLGVAENTRFVQAYNAVADIVAAGTLGEPRLARTFIYGSEVRRLSDRALWKGKRSGSGGGAVIDAGPHSFYLLRWLLGEFETVRAFANQLVSESEVEDHAVVAGRMASGALYTTEYTFTAEIPWGERLELYGSLGSVIVDQLHDPPAIHFRGAGDANGEPIASVPFDPAGWKVASIADGVADFVDAVAEGRPPLVTGEDGLHGVLVAERAYASIGARGVELPFVSHGPVRRPPTADRLLLVTDVSPYASAGSGTGPALAGVHGVLPQATLALAEVAEAGGLEFEHVHQARDVTISALERARVLALFTIGETPWTPEQRAVIESRLTRGELQLLALHSAADSAAGWPRFGEILGARFDGHPWTTTFSIDVRVVDHPSTRYLPNPWRFTDEVYLFRDLRPDARVLLEAHADDLDMAAPSARRPAHGFPLAWCFEYGSGRVFYTALGHFPGAYEDARFLGHLQGGLSWLLRTEKCPEEGTWTSAIS